MKDLEIDRLIVLKVLKLKILTLFLLAFKILCHKWLLHEVNRIHSAALGLPGQSIHIASLPNNFCGLVRSPTVGSLQESLSAKIRSDSLQ